MKISAQTVIYCKNQTMMGRNQAEDQLSPEEQNYRTLIEQIPGVVYSLPIHNTTQEAYISPQIQKLLGIPREVWQSGFCNYWLDYVHPDDRDRRLQAIDTTISTREPLSIKYRMLTHDGKTIWVKDQANLVVCVDGQTQILQGLIFDISDVYDELHLRQQAEAELKTQQAFLRQIIDVVPSTIFVKDAEGRFLTVNQAGAAIYGTTVEEMLGKKDTDVSNITPAQFAEFQRVNQEVMTTLQPKVIQAQAIANLQGEICWYQTIISPFINAQGQVQGVIGSCTDITALKQVEAELRLSKEAAETANRAKSTFLANMSHELRTPLNAILGFSRLMSLAGNISPEQQENLRIIRRSGEHLLILINQVLDLAKIEAGRMTLSENDFDLHSLLDDIENMFSLRAKEKGLQLQFHLATDVPQYIRTDEVKLRQVLINLISNAIKFTDVGSVLVSVSAVIAQQLTANKEPLTINFQVKDTGIGIAADELKSLFKPFVQTATGQEVQDGTGLGLTISRQFVQLMGGEITVMSRGKGFTPGAATYELKENTAGTTFEFTIPVSRTDTNEIQTPAQNSEMSLMNEELNVVVKAISKGKLSLTPTDFAALPPDLVANLRQAVIEGDLEAIAILIEQIHLQDEVLAAAILILTQQYHFQQLLNLLSEYS